MSRLWKYNAACGGCRILLGMFIIILITSCIAALTTFGKSNSNPPPTHVPIVKGRECRSHSDCDKYHGTSCVKDPNDYKKRCLCGDDTPPNNGLCPDVLKGLRHRCGSTNECEEGMICQLENTHHSNKLNQSNQLGQTTSNQSSHANYMNDMNSYNQRPSSTQQTLRTLTSTYEITICLCNNEGGYVEDNVHEICNGAGLMAVKKLFTYVVVIHVIFLSKYLVVSGKSQK